MSDIATRSVPSKEESAPPEMLLMSSFTFPDPSADTPDPAIVETSSPTPFAVTLTGVTLPPVVESALTLKGSGPPPSRPEPAAEVEILKLPPLSSSPVPAKLEGSMASLPSVSTFSPFPESSDVLTERLAPESCNPPPGFKFTLNVVPERDIPFPAEYVVSVSADDSDIEPSALFVTVTFVPPCIKSVVPFDSFCIEPLIFPLTVTSESKVLGRSNKGIFVSSTLTVKFPPEPSSFTLRPVPAVKTRSLFRSLDFAKVRYCGSELPPDPVPP